MFKQRRLSLEEAQKGFSIFQSIPIRFIATDFNAVLKISKQAGIYAYNAYFLDCAAKHKAPLLTLDHGLLASSRKLHIKTMEV